ncbi:MAG TPA: signal peptidase I [Acidimicrobiales bacterium]|nr:signal peptidase I [Acidimicrobiales bacterium]
MATEPEEQQYTTSRTLRELPILLLAAGLIAFLIKTFVAQAFYIPSGSMLPQLQINDRVVVSKLAYRVHEPRRGDIVVFDAPKAAASQAPEPKRNPVARLIRDVGSGIGVIQPSTEEFIKRVIGLPGETVDVKDGHVWINGHQLIEPYLPPGTVTLPNGFRFPITVPKGDIWVMGDNRGNSSDSRFFGPVPEDTVVGRTILRVWPVSKVSFL